MPQYELYIILSMFTRSWASLHTYIYIHIHIYIYIYILIRRLELGQKHLLATQSFMLHEKQSSRNCQKETIHGVL